MAIFKIEDLTYYYPRKNKPALDKINLTVDEGEFILLLGKSGSGKSTLGRVFNKMIPEFYGGKISGQISDNLDVGMVFQDPEKQLVMDKVERELAFGLENLGVEYSQMRKKVTETLSFLNMHNIKDKKVYELSGGQKQKTAIGSIIAMGHKFLVLDEPTSQLDPIVAEEVLNVLKKLNEELGYTIILIEQRIDRCYHLADRIIYMNDGQISFNGEAEEFAIWSVSQEVDFLPPVSELFVRLGEFKIPLTVKDGRKKLAHLSVNLKDKTITKKEPLYGIEVIKAKKVFYTYENGSEALKDINLSVYSGEVLAIMGETGGGKSTLLKNIAGLLKPTKGSIRVNGAIGYLSQNPNDYLFNDTVYEELKYTLVNKKITDYSRIDKTLKDLDIERYRDVNPRDLSGGERQRVALASVLVMYPDIIIMDEPTRGLDKELKKRLGKIILEQKKKGKTIILVTHDIEFSASYCDRACLMFDGTVVQIGPKEEVLASGIHYSTQISKLLNGYTDEILTIDQTVLLFNKEQKTSNYEVSAIK